MYKGKFQAYAVLTMLFFLAINVQARENIGMFGKTSQYFKAVANDCNDATSQIDLDINNVRTRMLGAGDFWWDLNDAKYEVPKVDPATGAIPVSSLFSGALWIGGIDAGGQLKIAAQTYRQSGNDFWPGPLNSDGSTDQNACNAYDRHWKISREEIDNFLEFANAGIPVALSNIPKSILEWPAKGNIFAKGKNDASITIDRNLAPYVDFDANGEYDPTQGDYPDVDGDQAIFWVYNDKGNIHTETGGDAIGLEIQALAFGFQTNDEINDMTFYKYEVVNYSSTPLDSVFFGQWVDADLGAFDDDYVGCDTALALGMCYNGDAVDGPTTPNYGANPPIVGTDFFQGPTKFIREGGVIVDSVRLGMSAFLYYDNDFSTTGNPEVAAHYYGYLTGSWKDGSPFTRGGNGFGGSEPSNFIFPDDPDAPLPAWSECSENNVPFDRRYLQSSGPFRLEPGAKNEVVVGVVWVRPSVQTGCFADFDAIRVADEKAQALFDANFDLIDGPDAPDVSIRELNNEIILTLTNSPISNNAGERYEESDPIIVKIIQNDTTGTLSDSTYNFQGYLIYQLSNGQVSPSEYRDPDKARLIAQVDVKDPVEKLVNFNFDETVGADVPMLMVDGNNEGIKATYRVLEDAFATDNKNLINHKTYYFSAVAYAFNEFKPYNPADANSQKKPYLEGRKNIKIYTAIPHSPTPELGGTVLNSSYGDGPEIVRIEGKGNGGQILEYTAETVTAILAENFINNPVYAGRQGPVDVKVVDPLRVAEADFEITFTDPSGSPIGINDYVLDPDSTFWVLTNLTSGVSVTSDFNLSLINEQVIPEWGISVTTRQVGNPGGSRDADTEIYSESEENNGFLSGTIEYERSNIQWLTGVQDGESQSFTNWIRAGIFEDQSGQGYDDYSPNQDENQVYETVLGGTWAPYNLAGQNNPPGVAYMPTVNIAGARALNPIRTLQSVDLVFTDDKSLWTRCVVVETGEDENIAPNGVDKLEMKLNPSVDQNGNPDGTGNGKSWFPGYALNLETGERLNIIFGEDGFLGADRGNDMIWNPTSTFFDLITPKYGGKHYVYIHKTRYDEGTAIHADLSLNGTLNKREVYKNVLWVGMPYLQDGFTLKSIEDGLIPTPATIRLRVTKPYTVELINGENGGYPKYFFSTRELAAETNLSGIASTALDSIRAVPNPYYAYTSYEQSQLDNRVKITNLPANCTVSIYSLNGTLIRRFERAVGNDNSAGGELNNRTSNLDTSLDWDMKNQKNIPVASGMYLIHIDAGELGEKLIKWFGVIRPIDLDTF